MSVPTAERQRPIATGAQRWLLSPWPAALLGLLCLVNSLSHDLTYDDRGIVLDNPRLHNLADFRAIWLSDWWQPGDQPRDASPGRDRLYRPLTLFTFAVNHAVGGENPFGYHLVNLLLHALVCILVWRFARRLCDDAAVASVAAVLYAVHPVHVEAVANIVGRAEILSTLFLLLGLLVLMPAAGPPDTRRALLAAPLFLLALLSKETAICYPAVALLILHRRLDRAAPARWWLWQTAALLAPLILYFPLRYVALDYHLTRAREASAIMNPLVLAEGWQRVTGALSVLGHYVRLLVAPATLSSDYGLGVMDPRRGVTPMTILGLLGVIGLIIALLGYRQRDRTWQTVATLAAILIASYALVSNTVLLIGVSVAERLMYWPSVPFAVLAGVFLLALWRRQCQPGQPLAHRARLLQVLGVLLVATLGLRSAMRSLDWRDNLTLCEQDVRTYPGGAHLNQGYASALMHHAAELKDPEVVRDLLAVAETHLRRALDIDPAYADALGLLARARLQAGDLEGARLAADAALLVAPTHFDATFVLQALSAQGRRSLAELRAAAEQAPEDAAAHLALGSYLLELGRPAEARPHLERATQLDPQNVDALRRWGQALAALGREDKAIDVFRRALALQPDDWTTHTNLSSLLAGRDPDSALAHARRAYELQPNDLRTHTNLAELHALRGETATALEILRSAAARLAPDDPFRRVIAERIASLEDE